MNSLLEVLNMGETGLDVKKYLTVPPIDIAMWYKYRWDCRNVGLQYGGFSSGRAKM